MRWYRTSSLQENPYEDLEALVDLFNEMPPGDLQMQIIDRGKDEGYTRRPKIWVSTTGGDKTHYIVDLGSGSFYVKGMLKDDEGRHSTMIFQDKGFPMQGDDLVQMKGVHWETPSEARERERWRAYH